MKMLSVFPQIRGIARGGGQIIDWVDFFMEKNTGFVGM